MAGVLEIKKRLERVKANLPALAQESVYESRTEFEESQKDQLFKGSDAAGNSFRQYKNSDYASMKNQANPLPGYGYPDLYLTGAFYNGIYVKVENGRVIIGSSDSKAPKLEKKYKPVFGLAHDEMRAFLYNSLKPVYQKKVVDFFKS